MYVRVCMYIHDLAAERKKSMDETSACVYMYMHDLAAEKKKSMDETSALEVCMYVCMYACVYMFMRYVCMLTYICL